MFANSTFRSCPIVSATSTTLGGLYVGGGTGFSYVSGKGLGAAASPGTAGLNHEASGGPRGSTFIGFTTCLRCPLAEISPNYDEIFLIEFL